MSTELNHEEVIKLLPVYALGALEPEEMLAVDEYITKHESLRAELRRAEDAVVQLAQTAPETPLPADAKSKLMERVHADLAVQAQATAVADDQPRPSAKSVPVEPDAPAGWFAKLWQTLNLNAWAAMGATAVALVAVVGLYALSLQNQLNQTSAELSSLQSRVSQLEIASNESQQVRLALQQDIEADQARLQLIASTDPQRSAPLPRTDVGPTGASGRIYVSDQGDGLLLLQGVEPLPTDQTYELWFVPEGETDAISAGLLEVISGGSGWYPVSVPLQAHNFSAVGLSIEPAGGSPGPGPSGPVILHTP